VHGNDELPNKDKPMGIRGLLGFLKERDLLKPVDRPMWPEGSTLAIDVPIFAHKFAYVERTIPGIERRMLAFGQDLRDLGAEPIFVFDGASLDLKAGERQARAAARDRDLDRLKAKAFKDLEAVIKGHDGPEGIIIQASLPWPTETASETPVFHGMLFPTKKDYRNLMELLKASGFKTAQAKYEAEALCAHLTRTGEAYAVVTEDSDAVAFGATRTILKFTTEPKIVVLDEVLKSLGLSREQFVDLCCMFGCDFCTNIYMIGPRMAYQAIQKYGSWQAFRDDLLQAPEVVMYGRANDLDRTVNEAKKFDATYNDVSKCFLTCAYESIETP
jgi:5'-3' exonuclease